MVYLGDDMYIATAKCRYLLVNVNLSSWRYEIRVTVILRSLVHKARTPPPWLDSILDGLAGLCHNYKTHNICLQGAPLCMCYAADPPSWMFAVTLLAEAGSYPVIPVHAPLFWGSLLPVSILPVKILV